MAVRNEHVAQWVKEQAEWLKPDQVIWCDGSEAEFVRICQQLEGEQRFIRLDEKEFPNSFWCRSNPNDVARVEGRTFICSKSKDDSGPTNNWHEPVDMLNKLKTSMAGCMQGRSMYVIPYLMGPAGSPFSKVGIEVTDSAYVVANMHIMARTGDTAMQALGEASSEFVKGVHSVGTLDPEQRYIAHFPEDRSIISFNSDYGGNALLGKKCFALRIASVKARDEGWLAEHMLILGITNPAGKKHYVCAAFPSACGKTNLAMLIPPEQYAKAGWKIETVGDDIAWLNVGADGRLYAINPEAGFFGVAPGTSPKTNPNALATLKKGKCIFTNTGLDLDRLVPWWEGLSKDPPEHMRDWLGRQWGPDLNEPAAHPNSRFTVPAKQCPSIDPAWESPAGVPISAIIFGGRRATGVPLVYQSLNWQHGVYVGLTMASETTAAAAGAVGKLRRDPMAMLPFIGYHAGDYARHWLSFGKQANLKLPQIFHVNWFRLNEHGKFLWPGFGDNLRVLEWILNRVDEKVAATESPLGWLPKTGDLNLEGLNIETKQYAELFKIDSQDWVEDLKSQREFFDKIGSKLPAEINSEAAALQKRLGLEKV